MTFMKSTTENNITTFTRLNNFWPRGQKLKFSEFYLTGLNDSKVALLFPIKKIHR